MDEWFKGIDYEELELLGALMKYNSDEIREMLVIMTYWDDMIKAGVINVEDNENISTLSQEKQKAIIDFVSNKLKGEIERNNNGNKKQKEKKLWHRIIYAIR